MVNMLVVEDNIYFSKLIINKIVQANKQIRLCMIATDGKEALDMLKNEKIKVMKRIHKELIDLGYNIKYIGTGYLLDSIYLLYFSSNKKNVKLERYIYPIIAKK